MWFVRDQGTSDLSEVPSKSEVKRDGAQPTYQGAALGKQRCVPGGVCGGGGVGGRPGPPAGGVQTAPAGRCGPEGAGR